MAPSRLQFLYFVMFVCGSGWKTKIESSSWIHRRWSLLCVHSLPVPWLLYTLIHQGQPVTVTSNGLFCAIVLLFLMLLFVIASIAACRWRMSRVLGVTMFALYCVFLVLSILLEERVIICPVSTWRRGLLTLIGPNSVGLIVWIRNGQCVTGTVCYRDSNNKWHIFLLKDYYGIWDVPHGSFILLNWHTCCLKGVGCETQVPFIIRQNVK